MPKAQPHQASSDSSQNVLLLSKLRPPRPASSLIERPALLSRLSRVLACPLTLLSAPAGFGKTTVLQQWLGEQKQKADFPPVAWVALDEGDNDPLRFWSYLFEASRAFQPHPAPLSPLQLARDAPPFGPPAPHQVVSTFVNEVTRLDCQGLLILEDYHCISEHQIHQTLTFLIDQLPHGLHLVLISRTDPPFSLARLRANHQLLEIHASQLAFSKAETLRFLQQTLPFDLPEEAAAQIEKQMEGWIAGLRLFTLGFQERTTPSEIRKLLSSFTGRHRHLLEYFLTEVLNAQPEAVQTFLLQTSHLQRLCAPLCDSVTGSSGSEQVLAEIERTGLFLQAIPDSAGWYRYHALFAEAMQHEARLRLGEAHVALCQKRSQSWYEHNGMLDEAIETALQRRASADALALLEQLLQRPNAFRERIYAILRWLHSMPEELLATSPLLCFAYASALTFTSSSDQLEAVTFTRVLTLLQYAEDQGLARHLTTFLAEVYALRALISVRQGKIPQAAHAARQALDILSPEQSTWLVICQTTLAIEARWLGHFQAAYQAMLPGLFTYRDMREQEGTIVLRLFLGELCLEQGTLNKAEEFFQTALREAREGSNDQARALTGIARLAYERNQLAQAEVQAQQALSISMAIDDRPLQAQATLTLARIAAASGNLQEAIKMLEARLVHLDLAQFPQHYREISLWQMRFALTSGDVTSVQRWLGSQEASDPLPVSRFQQEQEALLRARWLLQSGAAHDVVPLLEPWQEEAASNERLRSTLEIGLLLSMAYHQLKQPQEARKQLSEIIHLAHTEHYLRLFLDEGEIVTTLLSAQLTATREKSLLTYIRSLLQAFDIGQKPRPTPGTLATDPASILASLSPQERQVLRLLADGMERQEIAEHLVISLNTVKTHLQRLYQKLHVTNRFEAVEIARSLDLTD
jgi:ATP/maltotriose-dependent transcriptional regulator MalT